MSHTPLWEEHERLRADLAQANEKLYRYEHASGMAEIDRLMADVQRFRDALERIANLAVEAQEIGLERKIARDSLAGDQ